MIDEVVDDRMIDEAVAEKSKRMFGSHKKADLSLRYWLSVIVIRNLVDYRAHYRLLLLLVSLLLEELEALFNVAVLEAPQGLLHALDVLAHVDTAPLLAGLQTSYFHLAS